VRHEFFCGVTLQYVTDELMPHPHFCKTLKTRQDGVDGLRIEKKVNLKFFFQLLIWPETTTTLMNNKL
jgi:hypothetical protein